MDADEFQPTPLLRKPPVYEEWQNINQPTFCSAYDLAVNAERHATQQAEADRANTKAKENIISARVVGYLLIHLFDRRAHLTQRACIALATELVSRSRVSGDANGVIFDIGKHYRDHLLRSFRTETAQYPKSSSHPSRPSFDTLEDTIRDCMEADGKDRKTVRRKALVRDGFRCSLTGMFDRTSVKKIPAVAERCGMTATTSVITCHILNETTMQSIDPAGDSNNTTVEEKTRYAATAIAILSNFGLEDLVQRLLPKNGVHYLGNALSLDPTSHIHFDNLGLWFESTTEENRYLVRVADYGAEQYLRMFKYLETDHRNRQYVTFTRYNQNQELFDLPNPQLLNLHAVCARVAHMSGAAEAFDELECDAEEICVLAFDGSSAPLLDHCLTPLVTVPGVG